ncbi:MAG TPA: glutamate--cysteine ligase, partial [Epsilonproteobacteria bacterium]|nr:glutamate--cysteine ligase [Campylobacterota bacterium]
MGTEIGRVHFGADAWPEFSQHLKRETKLLEQRLREGACSLNVPVGGFEIEAWLIDREMRPIGANVAFLERFDSEMATAELAKFNFELNNTPQELRGDAFAKFFREMRSTCKHANSVADEMGIRTLIMGILPTLNQTDLCMENMSNLKRYHALNEQVLRERGGRPVQLDIASDKAELKLRHDSVMLESAATSFQIHTQIPCDRAHHYYNASILASAATVAISANSPFLFGKELWHETRIPLFEQSVDTGEGQNRVSFGSGFLEKSIAECFIENIEKYDILLPILFEGETALFEHLRLHNGTIWRWNRPLVGFDSDGTLHFRIEHRVMPSGPTLIDMLANAAFYYGIATILAKRCAKGHFACDFNTARENFYQAARDGLESSIKWEGRRVPVDKLVLHTLLPLAAEGLEDLRIDRSDSDRYLGIIKERVECG